MAKARKKAVKASQAKAAKPKTAKPKAAKTKAAPKAATSKPAEKGFFESFLALFAPPQTRDKKA
jgi:hypothetical protein